LRTQQIIAHESGVADTVDPLAGSYYVEWLTNKMEEEAEKYFAKIEELGGVIPAIKANFFQQEIANASYKYQQEIENKERIIVGVNDFKLREPCQVPILKIDESVLDAVREYASVGEIISTLKEVFGTYQEDSIF